MPWSNDQPRSRSWVAAVKRNAGGRCQIQLPGCQGRADVADHIIPIAEAPELADDVANGQGACNHCHGIKTTQEAARGRARSNAKRRHPVERHPGLA